VAPDASAALHQVVDQFSAALIRTAPVLEQAS
jgi:hypothetical protein